MKTMLNKKIAGKEVGILIGRGENCTCADCPVLYGEECPTSKHRAFDQNVLEFLRESNAIEDVYSEEMLMQSVFAWEYLMEQDTLTTSIVRKVHKILMLHSGLMPNEKGYFRQCAVYIGGHEAMKHQDINYAMKEWCKDINVKPKKDGIGGLESNAKVTHIMYEKIHPFVDGNGRTGRMFMQWHRIKKLGLPLLIIHTGAEQMDYYKWFR